MAVFWILVTLMTAAALAFVLVPLLRSRPAVAPSATDANLEVLRAQRREIDADVASGVLPSQERDAALAELVQRADQDLAGREAPAVRGGKPWPVAIAAGVLVPLVAFGTYLAVGTPRAALNRSTVSRVGMNSGDPNSVSKARAARPTSAGPLR